MGPAEIPASLAVPGQTYPATNSGIPLLQGHPVCADRQLPAIQQGDSDQSRKQRGQQNEGPGERTAGHEATERVQHP